MFFNEPVDLGVDWAASYIGDHPILRFVSIDNLKRGLGDQSPTSVMIDMIGFNPRSYLTNHGGQVLVHSTVPWGIKNKHLTLPEAEKLLAAAMAEHFPHWPQPKELKTLKWLYSQVDFSFTKANVVWGLSQICQSWGRI